MLPVSTTPAASDAFWVQGAEFGYRYFPTMAEAQDFANKYHARTGVVLGIQPLMPLACDMVKGCAEPITHIDEKGFIYCRRHGVDRQGHCRCRRLTAAELRRLQRGEMLHRESF